MSIALPTLLDSWGLDDFERGRRNYHALLQSLGAECVATLLEPLTRFLPQQADPDMALNNLERFFAIPTARARLPRLLEQQGRTLEELLQLFSTSQFFSDLLITDPDLLEVLWWPLRHSPTTEELVQQLSAEITAAPDDASVLRLLRRFRQKQHLRIGVNDIIRDRPLEEITRDLSRVADACVEVALQSALHTLHQKFGCPHTLAGHPSRCIVLAFGKLGGEELNYSSDIDLMFVYDEDGDTRGKRSGIGNDEFYARVVPEVVRLLSAHTDRGQVYRVDLRLRPEGARGPVARTLADTLAYYDTLGRTWERQALIKVRAIAGDRDLGRDFLRAIEPFVYRMYLSFAEINEIKAMKRRIEQKTHQVGDDERDVKTGRGGIRDIEFAIQFLQLLNGGDLPEVRKRGTLDAMHALESEGCLTDPEYRVLEDAYRFLRKTEHRLQILFDWQTHRLPDQSDELRKLALRMGYVEKRGEFGLPAADDKNAGDLSLSPEATALRTPQKHSPLDEPPIAPSLDTRDLLLDPLEQFFHDYLEKTRLNHTILDHLLHSTFADSDERAEPETDLILAPEPDEATIRQVLGRYPFKDVVGAYRNLTQLAQEAGPFLSTRRCRHFLASIAPGLLRAVAEMPDPDMTLVNLEKVTSSLGAKAVLWELFSFNEPSLRLYVDLCSNSPFLSQILIHNPGMIDDLLDSLILNRPRTAAELQAELKELCRGVDRPEAIEPILHSFQDKELLRIGVRDLLSIDNIRATTLELSNLAETLLAEIMQRQEARLTLRFGIPLLEEGERSGQANRYVMLALGKLGGREMSYHSDLDLVLVYEGEGHTVPPPNNEPFTTIQRIDTCHYFTELAQHIIRASSQTGPMGKLYDIDMRLRPTGQSGNLVLPLAEFQRYFDNGSAQIWERQSLTRTRVVYGAAAFGAEVMSAVHKAIHLVPTSALLVEEIRTMRERLAASASVRSLKRGKGGLTDVEFLVQMFQLKYGSARPELAQTNTWDSLDALRSAGLLSAEEHETLTDAYSFLRRAEARLRIVTNRPLNEYPDAPEELEKFARRMGFEATGASAAERFLLELQRHTAATRELFERLTQREKEAG